MTTDWKALCAELADVLAEEYGVQREFDSGDSLLGSGAIELLSRVRAALSQPEPEGLTEEEILNLSEEHDVTYATSGGIMINPYQDGVDVKDDVLSFARALIAADRAGWGRPYIEPVTASKRPWEREGWCDAKGQCWMGDGGGNGFVPSWRLCKPSDCRLRWSLPHYALPVPETNGQT